MYTGILDNREMAFLIWGTIFLFFCYLYPSIRIALLNVLKAATNKKLLFHYTAMVAYSSAIIYLVFEWDWFESADIKKAAFWMLFIASPVFFAINKQSKNKKTLLNIVKEEIKLTAIVTFILEFYKFSLLTELIFIPTAFFIYGLLAVAEREEKYRPVAKLLNALISGFGFFMIFYTGYHLITEWSSFFKQSTLEDFLFTPVISLLFLPYVLYMVTFMNYETNFVGITRAIKSPDVQRFAKKQALIKFNLDLEGLERWKFSLFWTNIKTKEDVIKSIEEIKEVLNIEKNPPKISAEQGWSPYEAKDYLKNAGMIPGHYFKSAEDDWLSTSQKFRQDGELLTSDLSYFVSGDKFVATKLSLLLNINIRSKEAGAIELLLKFAEILYLKSLKKPIHHSLKEAIKTGKNLDLNDSGKHIVLTRNEWNTKNKGYSLRLDISLSGL